MSAPRRQDVINFYHLGEVITELLDLPPHKSGAPVAGRKLARTIMTVITNALRRGEDVTIPGFGIFRVVTQRPRGSRYVFVSSDGIRDPEARKHPAKKVVRFYPAEALTATITETPNWHERRAISRWTKE